MGKCVSSMDDKGPLRDTAYFESKPFDVKISEDDYSFLQYQNKKIKKDSHSNEKELPSVTTEKSEKEAQPDIQVNTDPMDNFSIQFMNASNPQATNLQDEEDMLNEYNTKSKIIKLSKKSSFSKRKKAAAQQAKISQKQVNQRQEIIQATLVQQGSSSTMSLKHQDIEIQFSLPRYRAGPLVVPCIPYEAYSLN